MAPPDEQQPLSAHDSGSDDVCPIVGIGASAGGIDALQHFFRAVPADCGIAFVVVQHLAPDFPSNLPALLSRISPLPVEPVSEDVEVEAGTVYVIPPNTTLTLKDCRLHLGLPDEPRGQRYPIDSFLLSLAGDQGENAACVILSGTGSDGTIGLRAIKEYGGLTLAQSDAEYDGMMRSAVATGLVDFVLPAEELPAKLVDYFRHLGIVGGKKGPDGVRQETTDHLTQIAALIRARTGNDFKDYKDKTVARRVDRRMQVLQIDDMQDYIDLLRSNPREIDLLFQDLLIGVTNFFRDPEAFEALEKLVIPRLFEGKGHDDTVRVWVAGCATGEEAYSIAMLLREYEPKSAIKPNLQIFASDIDAHALDFARLGRYPEAIARDVPPARLTRFFRREEGAYQVTRDIREICLFSLHNILRDAPFSKLDLFSCRNLLIYLNAEVQDRIFPLFRYALRDDGYLFLGSSENVTRHARLFTTVDKQHRIFRGRPLAERYIPEFPLIATEIRRPRQLPLRGEIPPASMSAVAERQVLDRFSPAYVLVNAEGDILHASVRTGKYLELPAGAPDANVITMARPGLRLDLRAALRQAQAGQPVVQRRVMLESEGGTARIDLAVHPFRTPGSEETLFLVVFQEPAAAVEPAAAIGEPAAVPEPAAHGGIEQVEAELQATRERLQSTTQELESANEELKSSNEELSSMNEELQSTNEELETSREKLQSINEELQTVNAELSVRVDELSRSNSDMANLLQSTQIATVFLDRDLRIKSFTPAAKDVFRLLEGDIGRPIVHVRSRFRLDRVQEDAERVLRTLAAIEQQVESTDNDTRYVLRILPYRTVDNVIDGVVLTFTDVSRITAAEARISALTRDLRERVDSLETLLDLVPIGIFMMETAKPELTSVNRAGARLLGESADFRGLNKLPSAYRLFDREREVPFAERPMAIAARTGEPVASFEGRLRRPDGSAVDVMKTAIPLFDEHGKPRAVIAAVVDISERKRAEQQQQVLLHELQHRVKNILATISSLASRMLRSSGSLQEFSEAFRARLMAMSSMHDLLSQRQWIGADLRMLVVDTVSPYASAREREVELRGPEVLLEPERAAALGMVLHELTTNAAKYGALASSEGHLAVSWNTQTSDNGDSLHLTWLEQVPRPISPPDREGFGSSFIRRSVEYELAGTVDLAFEPGGLHCSISIPLTASAAERSAAQPAGEADGG
jgi:two-component system CheB/CheR fusion protein